MASLKKFEDIEAWQKARELTRVVYALSGSGTFARDFGLRDQIRRAAVSVMSNIAEGLERGGSAEFSQFLAIAKGSAGEVEAQLYVAFDQKYISKAQFDSIRAIAASTKKLIAGCMNYLKQSNIKGQKFKSQPQTINQRPETR
ncbi:MAG: four helix bundle protein [Desulfosarcina sp.]|nr:four helix bundle protein [Desulfosarcina sp.]